jgi:hypothetical protein
MFLQNLGRFESLQALLTFEEFEGIFGGFWNWDRFWIFLYSLLILIPRIN